MGQLPIKSKWVLTEEQLCFMLEMPLKVPWKFWFPFHLSRKNILNIHRIPFWHTLYSVVSVIPEGPWPGPPTCHMTGSLTSPEWAELASRNRSSPALLTRDFLSRHFIAFIFIWIISLVWVFIGCLSPIRCNSFYFLYSSLHSPCNTQLEWVFVEWVDNRER